VFYAQSRPHSRPLTAAIADAELRERRVTIEIEIFDEP
jgi:hypothetical protein